MHDRFFDSTRGKIVGLFGRLTYRVLGPYFREERGLLAHLVRVNEALEQRCIELTLFCEQLSQDMIDRQVAEAENQTKLAILLDVEAPGQARPGSDGSGPGSPGGVSTLS